MAAPGDRVSGGSPALGRAAAWFARLALAALILAVAVASTAAGDGDGAKQLGGGTEGLVQALLIAYAAGGGTALVLSVLWVARRRGAAAWYWLAVSGLEVALIAAALVVLSVA